MVARALCVHEVGTGQASAPVDSGLPTVERAAGADRLCVFAMRGAAASLLVCRHGGGLAIPHPNGIVIHPGASVGPNCLIFQQVTLGDGGPIPGLPTVGGHVDIGAGAKILGGVSIGDHAKIGANAVVLCDVPPHATAVGVPARIIAKDGAR